MQCGKPNRTSANVSNELGGVGSLESRTITGAGFGGSGEGQRRVT